MPPGEFLDQVAVPIEQRGGEEPGAGGQSGSSGRGRSWARAGHSGEARPPGKRRLWPLRPVREWYAGRRWRGAGGPEPGRLGGIATQERLDLGCDSPRLRKRRMAGPRRFPGGCRGRGDRTGDGRA